MFCAEIFPNLAGREIRRGQNVNEVLTSKLPGNADRLKSADEIVNNQDLLRFNIEYLHTLNPNGFPNHDLCLKKNMLHHQMHRQQTSGMQSCWKLESCANPRITFIPKVCEFTFKWQRRQLPLQPLSTSLRARLAGIWLRTQVKNIHEIYI